MFGFPEQMPGLRMGIMGRPFPIKSGPYLCKNGPIRLINLLIWWRVWVPRWRVLWTEGRWSWNRRTSKFGDSNGAVETANGHARHLTYCDCLSLSFSHVSLSYFSHSQVTTHALCFSSYLRTPLASNNILFFLFLS